MSKTHHSTIILVLVFVFIGVGVYALGQYAVSKGYGKRTDPALVLPTTDDHNHADYAVTICGEEQPIIPAGPGEVHTHGDGKIHIHPHTPAASGAFANLGLFFRTHGGSFTRDALQYPGQDREWKNGDACPDGRAGTWSILVNSKQHDDFDRYVPQEGDTIEVRFE